MSTRVAWAAGDGSRAIAIVEDIAGETIAEGVELQLPSSGGSACGGFSDHASPPGVRSTVHAHGHAARVEGAQTVQCWRSRPEEACLARAPPLPYGSGLLAGWSGATSMSSRHPWSASASVPLSTSAEDRSDASGERQVAAGEGAQSLGVARQPPRGVKPRHGQRSRGVPCGGGPVVPLLWCAREARRLRVASIGSGAWPLGGASAGHAGPRQHRGIAHRAR